MIIIVLKSISNLSDCLGVGMYIIMMKPWFGTYLHHKKSI